MTRMGGLCANASNAFGSVNVTYGRPIHIAVSSIRRNCIIRLTLSAKRHSARDWLAVKTGSQQPQTVQNQFVSFRFVRRPMHIDETTRNDVKRNETKRTELRRNSLISFRFVSFRLISSMCIGLKMFTFIVIDAP